MNRREAEEYLYCAMSIGEQLLVSGAEVGRVEDTIRRICLAYGAERADVFSITSSIVTTIYGADFGVCTQTRRVSGMVNDLDRVDQLNQLSREICQEKPTHEEIKEKLTQIQNRPHYSFGMQLLIYAPGLRFLFCVFRRRLEGYGSLSAYRCIAEIYRSFREKRFRQFSDYSPDLLHCGRISGKSGCIQRNW